MSTSLLFSQPIANLVPSFRAESELGSKLISPQQQQQRNSSQARLRLMVGCKATEKLSIKSLCRRYYKLQIQHKLMKALGNHIICKLNSRNFPSWLFKTYS